MAKANLKSSKRKRARLPDTDETRQKKSKSQIASRKKYGAKRVGEPYKIKGLLATFEDSANTPTVLNGDALTQYKPLFVTNPKLAKNIIKGIKKGLHFGTVCRTVGISMSTFTKWLERGANGYSPEYVEFYKKVCKAEAKAETTLLEQMERHKATDWRPAAWQLERRWPEHWAKKDRRVAEMNININAGTDSKENLKDSVQDDMSARELARKMIEGTEFGYTVEGEK